MIALIQGELIHKDPSQVIIDCNGVGYEIKISLNTYSKIGNSGKVRLFTRFIVREDAQLLYGFSEFAEKQLFDQLISIQGVGGNTAITILSSISPKELERAIATENVDQLKKVKGIGPKTAGRIILELKGKLKTGESANSAYSGVPTRQEAVSALVSLGFLRAEMEKKVDQILMAQGSGTPVEEIIKKVLRG